MSAYNSLRMAAALALGASGLTSSASDVSATQSPKHNYNLEGIVATAPVRMDNMKSGLGIYPAKDSYHTLGLNGVAQFEVYSSSPKTEGKLYINLIANEGVYDLRNEHKYDAQLIFVPKGSSVPESMKPLKLEYKKTLDGKLAYGGLVAVGAELATGKWAPSLAIGAGHTALNYLIGVNRDRHVDYTNLANIPKKPLQTTEDQVIVPFKINGIEYVLSIDAKSVGKDKNTPLRNLFKTGDYEFNPNTLGARVVDLKEKFNGQGQGLVLNANDNRMIPLVIALAEGYGLGNLYDALTKPDATFVGGEGNGGPITPPNTTPPTVTPGITGGEGVGSGITPPRG